MGGAQVWSLRRPCPVAQGRRRVQHWAEGTPHEYENGSVPVVGSSSPPTRGSLRLELLQDSKVLHGYSSAAPFPLASRLYALRRMGLSCRASGHHPPSRCHRSPGAGRQPTWDGLRKDRLKSPGRSTIRKRPVLYETANPLASRLYALRAQRTLPPSPRSSYCAGRPVVQGLYQNRALWR
jgi:hypothetical protein